MSLFLIMWLTNMTIELTHSEFWKLDEKTQRNVENDHSNGLIENPVVFVHLFRMQRFSPLEICNKPLA